MGGISKYIRKGDIVFLKPNFNTADEYPGSSDYDFLKTIVEIVSEHDIKKIILGDSCTLTQKTKSVMEEKGIFDLLKFGYPLEIIDLDKGKWVRKSIPNGKYLKCMSIPEILSKVDKLIYLPCLKTHMLAQYTGALKLTVGFMKTSQRLALHARHLQEKIGEMNAVINPDLVIMDARKCFISKGPMTGPVREPGLMLASESRVNIDIEGVKIIQEFKGNSLMGIKPEKLAQIKTAIDMNIN